MLSPKCELVRFRTDDDFEFQGLLFDAPDKKKVALIHVHAWIGNFYENEFIDHIAKQCVREGISFLTFANRGTGIVTDIIRKKGDRREYARIGGCLERFEDCLYDIKSAIDFLHERGYDKIVLEGHSLGCHKIAYYQHKKRDRRVKGLVFIAPVDDVGYVRRQISDRYEEALELANKMVDDGRAEDSVPEWMAFYPMLSAKRFLDVSDANTNQGRIFYYEGKLKELKEIDCPSLAVFGSLDDYEENPRDKLDVLKKVMKRCEIVLVDGSDHWFSSNEEILGKTVSSWSRNCLLGVTCR